MPEPFQPTPSEIAAYLERMVVELAALARNNRLEMLAYLLGIAAEEAAARVAEARAARPPETPAS